MNEQMHQQERFEHNGERKREESAWTWVCSCGDSESGSTKAVAEFEWRCHLGFKLKVPTETDKFKAKSLGGLVVYTAGPYNPSFAQERCAARVYSGTRWDFGGHQCMRKVMMIVHGFGWCKLHGEEVRDGDN